MAIVRPVINGTRSRRIWHVAAECSPAKTTGGLSHAVHGIAKAEVKAGHKVCVFTPQHAQTLGLLLRLGSKTGFQIEPVKDVSIKFGNKGRGTRNLWIFKADIPFPEDPSHVITYYFIDRADGRKFGNREIYGYGDDAKRYLFFNKAVAELLRLSQTSKLPDISPPDVIHGHDWPAAFLGYFLRWNVAGKHIPLIYTVHNLGYATRCHPHEDFYRSTGEEDGRVYSWNKGFESYGYIDPHVAARRMFDYITTVSATYGDEIERDQFPDGSPNRYASLFRSPQYRTKKKGIRNGIPDDFNIDKFFQEGVLPETYGEDDLAGKGASRRLLQRIAGLEPDDESMIMVSTGRWAGQKGTDLIQYLLRSGLTRKAKNRNIQFVTVGSQSEGEPFRQRFLHFKDRLPGRVGALDFFGVYKVNNGRDKDFTAENLEALALAGADVMLMPSRYEPCGLAQMYALMLGTLVIATRTGGLADTIIDDVTGFHLDQVTPDHVWKAINRAYATFKLMPHKWQEMMIAAMQQDFSWSSVVPQYIDVYEEAIALYADQ